MNKIILFACLLVISGCARNAVYEESAFKSESAPLATWDQSVGPLHSSYLDCMDNYGKSNARSKATSFEIAEAAESKCIQEYRDFELAEVNYWAVRQGASAGVRIGENNAKKTLATARGSVIQIVVEARK